MSIFPTADDTIYLDHAATTPLDPEVLAAMAPWLTERFGNPSSIYRLGQEARAAIDDARGAVARVLGCGPAEIVFTSGATEANNLAVKGIAWQRRLERERGWDAPLPHVVTTAIEHHAVLHAATALERHGFPVTYVQPDAHGIVAPDRVEEAIRPETCLVSVMSANNETGAVQPVAEIGRIARQRKIPFHVDAVQGAGLLPLRVDYLGCDLLALSAHKFYGPKGVGLLYLRRGTPIEWQQDGGGQEGGRRGGTENVAGIVGLAAALTKADAERPAYAAHCAALRDRLEAGILGTIPDAAVNGPTDPARRLPNNLNVAIPGIQGETVLLNLDMEGVAASAGSACTTGNSEPSHVLLAMGLGAERCRESLRFTVGRATTADQIDETVEILAETVARVRELAGVA
ncbi:MAG: cysteine desulfurase [Chloroflexia bacterium]|nr:cysteine desulfurase [Chloroflexia bacterium]